VLGFERGRYNCAYTPEWPHVLLGRTRDKRYVSRIFALLAAVPALFDIRELLRSASVYYARNVDQLILALFSQLLFNRRAVLVYEILDVQPVFTGTGILSRMLRWVERRLLARVQLLVVSSPAFHRNYYLPVQGYRGPWFLLENKLHRSALNGPQRAGPTPLRTGRPWRVGYFGLIRGEATLELISRIAPRLQGVAEFIFRGVLTTIDTERFAAAVGRNRNIHYGGEYDNPRELAEIYGAVDFAWALDLENIETNSRWLRPCRFYEAGLFGVPCLTKRDFEIGDLVEQLGVGWSLGDPLEDSIVSFFEQLTPTEYASKRDALHALPRASFLGEDDAARLSDFLREQVEGRKRPLPVRRPANNRAGVDAIARSTRPLL